jgi:hypothetical protein
MKNLLFVLLLSLGTAHAGEVDVVMRQIYGTYGTACTQDTDADTAQHNRLGPLTANRRYVMYCHDGAGASVACECIQGTATVDASAVVGVTLFLGEKIVVLVLPGKLYVSCVPFVDNQKYDLCPLD